MSTTAATSRPLRSLLHSTDTYGLVLFLILLDYLAIATLTDSEWGKVCIVFLQGVTIWFTLRASESRHAWQTLALVYLVLSVLTAAITTQAPRSANLGKSLAIFGGLLLISTPFVISRHIASHTVISTATVLGAISVYLLIGMCFAYIYLAIGAVSAEPFFVGLETATINNFLFFSYTTLTTVGYGDLVPAGYMGQTFAMLEALVGQIYLVIVVARLVALWGQKRPDPGPLRPSRRGELPTGGEPGAGDGPLGTN